MRPRLALTRDQRLILLSSLLWGFGMSLFIYIQPLYIAYLGASPEEIGLALGLSGLLVTLAYVPLGLWADRRGRKPVIVAGWVLATLAMLAMGLAPDWRWFIPAWSLFLFSNFAVPALYGYIAAGEQHGNLNRTFALLASGSPLGALLSPAIGGWIGETLGLRAVYLTATGFALLSTLVLMRLGPQPVQPPAIGRLAPRGLLRDRGFLYQLAFTFLLFAALDLGHVMVPKFLQDVRGLSVGEIGLMGTVSAFGIVLLTLALGHLPQDSRRGLLLGQALSLSALALWLLSPAPALIGLAYFIHGSNRVLRPLISGRLARRLDAGTMSLGYGFQQTAMQLAWAIGPFLAGVLYGRNVYWPFYASLGALGLTLFLTYLVPQTRAVPGSVAAPAGVVMEGEQ